MKKRIVTGVILIILAVFWLTFSFGDGSLALFEGGLYLLLALAAFEYSQFVFPNAVHDEMLLKSPGEFMRKNSRLIFALRALYTAFILCFTNLIYLLVWGSSDLPAPFADDVRVHQLFAAGANPLLKYVFGCSAAWWIAAAFFVLTYPHNSKIIHSKMFRAVAGIACLVPFFFAFYIIRCQSFRSDFYVGVTAVLSVMVLVWAADSGAYFVGRAAGKHKMSPAVSPNKTVEGLCGGLLLALAVFAVLAWRGCYGMAYGSMPALAAAAAATVVFSVIGDLWESLLKRETGMKDTGFILPGHGGVLDRIDSMLAAVPVFLVTYAAAASVLG